MAKLVDLIRIANSNRNKQQHRINADSKRGRQFLAANKERERNHLRDANARKDTGYMSGPRTKPDTIIFDDVISEGNIRSNK